MAGKASDITKIVVGNDERLTVAEQQISVHHERIGILEKTSANLSGLPSTVAALGQEVKSLGSQMIREVDGLREQQKAHKEETTKLLEDGFKNLGDEETKHRAALESKILGAISLKEARETGWWEVLELGGKIVVGAAVIAEAFKIAH